MRRQLGQVEVLPVVILTSAVGLGVYIPALLIRQQLLNFSVPVSVEVLEDFYTAQKQKSHIIQGEVHHASFAMAQMAHRMARDVQDCLEDGRIDALLQRWRKSGSRRFIVWSGFWLPVLERYRSLTGWSLAIDHCRIDAEMSASFKVHRDLQDCGREIWLWHGDSGRLVYEIPVSDEAVLPFPMRESRLTVHGGGWGIGTYLQHVAEMREAGLGLDIVLHQDSEEVLLGPIDAGYRLRPGWHAWQRNEKGELQFPPMEKTGAGGYQALPQSNDHHAFYSIIRRNRAIVSKPGGGTLIDSLASATPVVLLEPYGYAEARNGDIWRSLGFGVDYKVWQASGYDSGLLEQLHQNLLGHSARGVEYPRYYAESLTAEVLM